MSFDLRGLLSPHTPPHQPMRCDGFSNQIRNAPPQTTGCGSAINSRTFCAKRRTCNETHNQGNPFDTRGTSPANNPRRKGYCAPPTANPLFLAQSLSTLAESIFRQRYRRRKVREFP